MMKISKPVLADDLLISSVQFTSLNSIVFKNVKNVYDGNEKIRLEYEHSSKIEASSSDWIGIFPHGWTTLQQYITFEWVSQSLPSTTSEQNKENADLIRRVVNFCPKYLTNSANVNSFYQFVYISKQIEVLGVSCYFRFDVGNVTSRGLEVECLVPVSSNVRSTSVSDFGILLGNSLPSSTSIDTRTLQTSSIHSLQNLDSESKNWAKPPLSLNGAAVKKTAIFPRKNTGTADALDPYTSHSEPIFPMSFQMANCKKCFHFKRGGELLRSQQVLQSKVGPHLEGTSLFGGQRRTLGHELSENKLKIVMERNKVLEERSQEMKKVMDKMQAESKKLKMSFYNVNKEKVAYEKFVKDFIKSLEKDSIILVKRVNYVGMGEHPRDKKTSKRERELKAVIGLQEITIRNLINSLQEKAKSVNELNETVKLAQAFSSARSDSRDYGSDVEEGLDEGSNSDVNSEYEFSLTKPQPPEESALEETNAVLDEIRRTTEMELKDIGINRSLGKSASRDSELNLPNLSVRSYCSQNEGTGPKKPRLFDNLDDCWPYSDSKRVHRTVIESSPRIQDENENDNDDADNDGNDVGDVVGKKNDGGGDEAEPREMNPEDIVNGVGEEVATKEDVEFTEESENDEKSNNLEDSSNYEDYYDAYEDNENISNTPREKTKEPTVSSEQNEDAGKTERDNFLVTAIIPKDMDLNSMATSEDEAMKVEQEEEMSEKKVESPAKKGKKFSCELSIDFSARKSRSSSYERQQPMVTPVGQTELVQNGTTSEVMPFTGEIKQEKSLVMYKKNNQSLEIKITQLDQKDNQNKNYVHQKMVVKFGKDSQEPTSCGPVKPSKFEFNLALTGREGSKPQIEGDPSNFQDNEIQHVEEMNKVEEASPRTVWNDAAEEEEGERDLQPQEQEQQERQSQDIPEGDVCLSRTDSEAEDTKSVSSEDAKEDTSDKLGTNSKLYEDSLRYEKNLEFLQQKSNDRPSDADEVTSGKPSAILIQNGQTKLALIRYQ
ncbi:hypothetical protein RUM43_002986 [Polyplax serrata]|uniref:SKICH domain-containing protein n=1 Tax=Polyplax serrata TaxID=468196 RepID=A0AAN8S6B1_POLSC